MNYRMQEIIKMYRRRGNDYMADLLEKNEEEKI